MAAILINASMWWFVEDMCLEITYLKLEQHFPGAKEFNIVII